MTRSVSVTVGVAVAVVLSVLAASAPPVGAANTSIQAGDGLVVESLHTSNADFRDSPSRQNAPVYGDDVVFRDHVYNASDAVAVYPLDGSVTDTKNNYDGSTQGSPTFTESAWNGQAIALDGTDDALSIPTSTFDQDSGTFSMTVRADWSAISDAESRLFNSGNTSGADYEFRTYGNVWNVNNNTGSATESVSFGSLPDNKFARLTFSWKYHAGNDSTVIRSYVGDDLQDSTVMAGKIARPDEIRIGTWYESNYFPGTIDEVAISQTAHPPELDQQSDGVYYSDTHVVGSADAAFANVTLQNASLDYSLDYYDGSGWTTATTGTWTSSGNHSVSLPSVSEDKWRLVATFKNGAGSTTAKIHDEGILFTNHAPQADNLSPPDGTKLQERSTNYTVDVSDPEFPTAQGDSVDAELLVDGEVVGSQTVTSNQTVSVMHELTEGGQHTYQWRLTDSYGSTTTTSERTLTVPATLEVRSVANQTLVDAENATITFYGGPNEREIVERPVENGEVSLTGLPANTEFTVVVRADGYYTRTAVIPSLYDQSITWLLPKNNTDAVEVVFQLDDRTGDFAGSDSTQLRVQRAIEYNNSTQWYDVVGDDISATSELATILENQQRYRLIVSNDQQTRILGSYTPSGPADPEIIPIGRIEFSGDTDAGVSLDAELLNETQPAVRIMAFNPDRTADRLVYRVVNTTGNESTVIANTTISNPESFAAVSAPLTGVDSIKGQTYRVEMWAYEGEALVAHSSTSVGTLQGFGLSEMLNNGLMTMGGYVFLIAGAYGTANYSPRLGALMGVIIGGALTIYGILSIPHVVLGYTGSIAVIRQAAAEG